VRGDLDSIGLMEPDNPLIGLLALAIRTSGNDVSGIRFTNNVINGQLVPDAYIYASQFLPRLRRTRRAVRNASQSITPSALAGTGILPIYGLVSCTVCAMSVMDGTWRCTNHVTAEPLDLMAAPRP
jgi:hypothetical protein